MNQEGIVKQTYLIFFTFTFMYIKKHAYYSKTHVCARYITQISQDLFVHNQQEQNLLRYNHFLMMQIQISTNLIYNSIYNEVYVLGFKHFSFRCYRRQRFLATEVN